MKTLIDWLSDTASENVSRAYDILGAKPGPGIDVMIEASQPMDGSWIATGITPAGIAWLKKFHPSAFATTFINDNRSLYHLKSQLTEWGLTYDVSIPFERIEE
jgi:hypothetical protein